MSEPLAAQQLVPENQPCLALTGAGVPAETFLSSRTFARQKATVQRGLAWSAALSADRATHGRLGAWAALSLFVPPAVLAAAVNLALGRGRRSASAAALLATLISAAGFVAFVVYFFLTVPDEFFN